MRRYLLGVLAALVLASAASTIDPRDYEGRLAAIRFGPDQLRWQEIPWLNDLIHGMRLSKEEKRPLLLYVVDDEPLERC